MQLKGKVAIVTGAGQGIGRAVALDLADAGAAVAILERDADTGARTVAEITARGGDALVVAGDVRDRAVCEAVSKRARPLTVRPPRTTLKAPPATIWP